MINNIHSFINQLKKDKSSLDTVKHKKGKGIHSKQGENRDNFSLILNNVYYSELVEEFGEIEPEDLIHDIIDSGKHFQSSRKQDDLEHYKHLLSGFIACILHKSSEIIKIKASKGYKDIEEKYYTLIIDIQSKYKALAECFFSSQVQIFKLIDEIEGILVNIKV